MVWGCDGRIGVPLFLSDFWEKLKNGFTKKKPQYFKSWPGWRTRPQHPRPNPGTRKRPWWLLLSPPRVAAPSCRRKGGRVSERTETSGKAAERRRRSGVTYLGPKHMQRLAKYPLEKEKKIMMMMYQASCSKNTGTEWRGLTLHSMKSGTKTSRNPTRTGSQMLSLPGCREKPPVFRVVTQTGRKSDIAGQKAVVMLRSRTLSLDHRILLEPTLTWGFS